MAWNDGSSRSGAKSSISSATRWMFGATLAPGPRAYKRRSH